MFRQVQIEESMGSAAVCIEPTRVEPIAIKPPWWDEEFRSNYEGNCRDVVKLFVEGKLTRKQMYASNGFHIYSTRNNGAELWLRKNNPSIKVSVCVARKVGQMVVGNSSSLGFLREPKTGRIKAISHQPLKIQDTLAEVMPMIPFSLFKEQNMDLKTLTIIDKGDEEMLDLGRKQRGKEVLTHYTGALVFKIKKGKNSDQYFLFDIDRNDLKLKNLNFFLSRLSRSVTSITDAYTSLKPQEVFEAEQFLGRECDRQGEWFFIPVQGNFKHRTSAFWGRGRPKREGAILQSKGNRAHYVEFISEEGYVKGRVTHGGFEHKPIVLDGWHKAVPNTAVASFKISGAVD